MDSGFWVLGGATLDEPQKEGEGLKINGSVMMALAESREEVLEKIKSDTYFKNGVWDEKKVGLNRRKDKGGDILQNTNHGALKSTCSCNILAEYDDKTHADSLQIQIYPFKSAIRSAL